MTIFAKAILYTVLMVSVFTYLGVLAYLIAYLRRVYTTTWVELGEFELTKPSQQLDDLMKWYFAGMRTVGFTLFSNQYRGAQDQKLTCLIWLVRMSFASAVVVMLALITSGLLQRH